MSAYLLHYLAGAVFAVTGWWARGLCEHWSHRLLVGGGMLAVETALVVTYIG